MKNYSVVRIGHEYVVQADTKSILKVASRRRAARLVSAAVELLEVFQFLSRDAKPSPRHKDSPSLEERIPPVKGEIKNPDWDKSKSEKSLDLP